MVNGEKVYEGGGMMQKQQLPLSADVLVPRLRTKVLSGIHRHAIYNSFVKYLE